MQSFGLRDTVVYFVFTFLYILYDHGVEGLAFVLQNLAVCFWVPYSYLCDRYYLPFGLQTRVSQRATGAEFILIELLRYNLNSLDRKWGKEFFQGKVFQWVNRWRYLREAGSGLGDIKVTDHANGGKWFQSQSKKDQSIDVAIIYFHGSWVVGGSIEIYEEYLTSLCVKLQEEGFHNPVVLAPQILPSSSKLNSIVEQALEQVLAIVTEECHIVLAGDSLGATLIMNHLLVDEPLQVSATLLISPITQLDQFGPVVPTENHDYLSIETIEDWTDRKLAPLDILCPGAKDWLSDNVPKLGIIISYGSEECISKYTEGYIDKLKDIDGCKLKVDKQVAQVHNWAIINYYAERLVEHREESLQNYASILSRMLLAETKSYYNEDGGKVKRLISFDEKRV